MAPDGAPTTTTTNATQDNRLRPVNRRRGCLLIRRGRFDACGRLTGYVVVIRRCPWASTLEGWWRDDHLDGHVCAHMHEDTLLEVGPAHDQWHADDSAAPGVATRPCFDGLVEHTYPAYSVSVVFARGEPTAIVPPRPARVNVGSLAPEFRLLSRQSASPTGFRQWRWMVRLPSLLGTHTMLGLFGSLSGYVERAPTAVGAERMVTVNGEHFSARASLGDLHGMGVLRSLDDGFVVYGHWDEHADPLGLVAVVDPHAHRAADRVRYIDADSGSTATHDAQAAIERWILLDREAGEMLFRQHFGSTGRLVRNNASYVSVADPHDKWRTGWLAATRDHALGLGAFISEWGVPAGSLIALDAPLSVEDEAAEFTCPAASLFLAATSCDQLQLFRRLAKNTSCICLTVGLAMQLVVGWSPGH